MYAPSYTLQHACMHTPLLQEKGGRTGVCPEQEPEQEQEISTPPESITPHSNLVTLHLPHNFTQISSNTFLRLQYRGRAR